MHRSDPASPATLPQLLAARARATPERPAISAPAGPDLSYRDLHDLTREATARLRALEVRAEDRLAVLAPAGPVAATLFLAAASAGVSAPLNPAYGAQELEFYLTDLGARAVLVSGCPRSPVREVARRLGVPVVECVPHPAGAAGGFAFEGGAGAGVGASVPAAAEPEGPSPEALALVLHTSGTTGRPKQVPLTHGNLLASASHVAATLELGPGDLCLNVMPLFHIHGLVAALLASLYAGGEVLCAGEYQAGPFFSLLAERPVTWYTAVPTIHQAVVAAAGAHTAELARARIRFVRSSSAALPARTLEELERVFRAPVIEAYGMTEAAHQMTSNPLPPLPRKPGSVGPAAGPEVAVMDAAGALLAPGERGEVVVRGPNVTAGYGGAEDANARAFTAGWFRTGDQGFLDADGYLHLTGRFKELINRGGEKVAPLEVEEVLLAHPAVAQAVAFAVPHPTLGEDVAAAVVLQPGARAGERQLREFAGTRLAWFKVPRRVRFLDALPKGATGKLQRVGLAQRLGMGDEPSAPAQPSRPPGTPVEEIVAALWGEALAPPEHVHQDFFGAGGDSLRATALIARVRELLRVELPLLAFFDEPTVAGLAREVERELARATPGAEG